MKLIFESELEDSFNQRLFNYLYDTLDALSGYHEDLDPSECSTVEELMELYFYWASEYNDNYFPEMKQNTEIANYLKDMWESEYESL